MDLNPTERRWWLLRRARGELKTEFVGRKVLHFEEVTSTNEVAKEMARRGAEEGVVVIAEAQSRGRGRLGRRWISPRGGVWLTVILRPTISPEAALRMQFITAVSVARAIEETLGLEVEVKWPNDILIHGRKVCGILTESGLRGGELEFVALGVGINANIDINAFPEDLRESVTSLREEAKHEVSRRFLLKSLLANLERYYVKFLRGEFDQILDEWRSLTSMLGKRVVVTNLHEKIEGEAVDVDQDGALVIRLDGGPLRRVLSGDATVITIAEPRRT